MVIVLQNHVISCYRLPKATTKNLTSAVAPVLIDFMGKYKRYALISWDKLYHNKDDGGLGLKDFTDFSTSMLKKQFWRLIEKLNTLFSLYFKRGYFRNASPLDPIRSYSPSYGWRSIVSARSLVSKWLIKMVGSGSSFSVWNDPWHPTTHPRPENRNHHNIYPDLTVGYPISITSRTWNMQALHCLIDPHDKKIIKNIPLDRTKIAYRDGCHFTNNRKYTVKSWYHIERVYHDGGQMPSVYGPTVDALKAYCLKRTNCFTKTIFY